MPRRIDSVQNMARKEVSLVFEGMDEETLERMPEWFKLLRDAYLKKQGKTRELGSRPDENRF